MEVVSEKFRPTIYSGEANHHAILTIGNTVIDNENIKSIKLSNPIIDKTNDTFYIGTFISKQLDIEFYNADQLDLTGQVHLQIGTYIEGDSDYELTEDTEFISYKDYYEYEDNEYVYYDGETTGNPHALGLYEIVTEEGAYENLNIGYFNIETSPEDYYNNAKITALDNAVKFKPSVDYSSAMEYKYYVTPDTTYLENKAYYSYSNDTYTLLVVGTDYEIGDTITGTVYNRTAVPQISCEELLIWLCNHFGVTLGTYPNVNKNIEISTYDSSVSGKQYISYIAEIMGGNAQIGRNGALNIIPFKQTASVQIDATESKEWELGDKYEISRVVYFDAIDKSEASTGTETYNTLYIRQDNPFVVGDHNSRTAIVTNVYNAVVGTIIYNLKCENYADYSLDSWDYVTYLLEDYELTEDTIFVNDKTYYSYVDYEYVEYTDERTGNPAELELYELVQNTYNTINDNEYTYELTIMGKTEVTIPNKQVEETTNVVEGSEKTKYNILKTVVDNQNNEINIIAGQGDETRANLETLTANFEGLTNTYKTSGGSNLLYNSGLQFKDENGDFTHWDFEPFYVLTSDETYQENKEYYSLVNTTYVLLIEGTDYEAGDTITGNVYETSTGFLSVISDSESLSKTNIVLPNGIIRQTINVPKGKYSISFAYRQNILTATCKFRITNNPETILERETEWKEFNGDVTLIEIETGTDNTITIEFECDVQGGYYIKELMLNSGDEPIQYTQNTNETITDTVKIADGIEVASSATNTVSRVDSDGFRVLKKDTLETSEPEIVLKATDNGTETKSIISREDSEIASLIIKKYNGHILLSGKGDE